MKKKELILYIILFVIWFVLVLATGIHHEPWADEAQAWLIARDNSFFGLFSSGVLRYEGHPALWYIIVRLFILCGLPYKYFFVIPLLFMSAGVWLFLFKSKFPLIIKALLPFSFYIVYYSVVARSHSLVFFVLSLIACLYERRIKQPYLYIFCLFMLMSISAHSYVIALVLFVFYIVDVVKLFREENKIDKNILLSIILCFSCFLMTFLYVLPYPSDIERSVRVHIPPNLYMKYAEPLLSGYLKLAEDKAAYFQSLLIIGLYTSAAIAFCKTKKQLLFFIIMSFSLVLVMAHVYYMNWHSGYLFLTLIFVLWMLSNENKSYDAIDLKQKVFFICFGLMMLYHVVLGVKDIIFDCLQPYCGSREAVQFIKQNGLDKYEIAGLGLKTVALQPYFKNNIYTNYSKSYWGWNESHFVRQQNLSRDIPIFVVDYTSMDSFSRDMLNYLGENYNIYAFEGTMYMSGYSLEPNTIIICVKK